MSFSPSFFSFFFFQDFFTFLDLFFFTFSLFAIFYWPIRGRVGVDLRIMLGRHVIDVIYVIYVNNVNTVIYVNNVNTVIYVIYINNINYVNSVIKLFTLITLFT